MKFQVDEKTGIPKFNFDLEAKDIQDANEIQAMMDTRGWVILMNYYEVAKESLIDRTCDGIKTKAGREACATRVAELKAFRTYMAIPGRIIKRAEEFIAEQEKIKEEERANEPQDSGFVGYDGQ